MNYALLFFGQALNFLLAVINIRACAKGYMLAMCLTDFAICMIGFTLIRHIANAGTPTEALCYGLGGTCGSAIALKLTRRWDHTGT